MMILQEVLTRAKEYYADKGYEEIIAIYETDKQWIIYAGNKVLVEFGGGGITIDKSSGRLKELFLPFKHMRQVLDSAKKVDLTGVEVVIREGNEENKIDLSRFITGYKSSYEIALREVGQGRKQSHWMWYIFPQLEGLGRSETSKYYAIKSKEEAVAFLKDTYLGSRLCDITQVLLSLDEDDPRVVFGRPDDKKLRSSMTLFAAISEKDSIFQDVLKKFFDGEPDQRTIKLLNSMD